MNQRNLFRVLHGSKLFGTSTPASDTDIKAVVVPTAREIVLGEVNWSRTNGDSSRQNNSNDVDVELHDLLRFTDLLASGQPVALEMMFTPLQFHQVDPHPIFFLLQENREKFVSKRAKEFLGYCRRQAMDYGIKGERAEAAERALKCLERIAAEFGEKVKLQDHLDTVVLEANSPFVAKEPREMARGKIINHLKVVNRFAAETVTLAETLPIVRNVVKGYGMRSFQAGKANGKDWKALSHALRIGYEAVELFNTGWITLPRPEAARILKVKQGQIHAEEVGDEIIELLKNVELASENSHLPEAPNTDFLKEIVYEAYVDEVVSAKSEHKFSFQP